MRFGFHEKSELVFNIWACAPTRHVPLWRFDPGGPRPTSTSPAGFGRRVFSFLFSFGAIRLGICSQWTSVWGILGPLAEQGNKYHKALFSSEW